MSAQTDRPDDSNMGARVFWLGRVLEAATALSTLSGRRVPNPLSGTTDTSKISLGPTSELSAVREFPFNPNVTQARSHLGGISKVTLIGGVVVILAVALTAVTAGGQFTLADIWRRLAIDRTFELASLSPSPVPKALATRDEPSITRLVVQTARGPAGEPVPLGLTLRGAADGAVVHIKGLMPGMELSAGNAVGSDAWQISATDLGDAWIAPPEGFVGSADLVAELRLSDDKIVDRQGIKIEWGPPISPEPAPRQFEREEIVAGPTIAREPIQPQSDQEEAGPRISPEPTGPPISPEPAPRQFEREEIVAGPTIAREPIQPQSDQEEAGPRISPEPTGPPISPEPAPRQFEREEIVAGPTIAREPIQPQSDQAEAGPRISAEPTGPPISPEPAPRQFEREEIVAGATIARELTQPQSDQEGAGPRISPEPTLRQQEERAPPISPVPMPGQLEREEIAVLLKRGKDLMAAGDLAAARLVLKRAADANDVEATLALAATYDPYVLRELKVYSFAADAGMARAWYEKAKQLGSAVASRRLEMLASGAR
jgi:hypothetical protein